MTEKWWFWLAVGAVGVRLWESHCAEARGCHVDAFHLGNITNSVFELSGAGCAAGGEKRSTIAAGERTGGGACCGKCGESAGNGPGYKPTARTSQAVMEIQ